MRKRCLNPQYKDFASYGGRAIFVCSRWDSFENFLEDMGERPPHFTLGRVDNNGNYEPSNCRWESRKQQANNRRIRRDSKLNWDKIAEIHRRIEHGETQRAVAIRFGVSEPQVSLIRRGRIWNMEKRAQQ